MPTKVSKSPARPASSTDMQALHKRVKGSSLSADDKASVAALLTQAIKLRKIVEKAKNKVGDKVVIASLPNGFDIVK
jgi:hypothetical protein